MGYNLTALATAEKKNALQVDPIVKEMPITTEKKVKGKWKTKVAFALILILAEGGQKQAALCQENSLLALQTALATAEKKAALQVGGVVDRIQIQHCK
jgi:hypothetical protein